LVCRRFRSLRRAGVAARYAPHPALPAHARRDPGDPAGATLCGSLSAGLESAPVMKLTHGWTAFPKRRVKLTHGWTAFPERRVALAAALALIGLPVVIVPIEAFSFYSA